MKRDCPQSVGVGEVVDKYESGTVETLLSPLGERGIQNQGQKEPKTFKRVIGSPIQS